MQTHELAQNSIERKLYRIGVPLVGAAVATAQLGANDGSTTLHAAVLVVALFLIVYETSF